MEYGSYAALSFCQYLQQHPFDEELGLLMSFDGASRGNPGDASQGNAGWWGQWHGDGFRPMGTLYQAGSRIGIKTNNVAEARGLAFAAKSALHLLFWLTEVCCISMTRDHTQQFNDSTGW